MQTSIDCANDGCHKKLDTDQEYYETCIDIIVNICPCT